MDAWFCHVGRLLSAVWPISALVRQNATSSKYSCAIIFLQEVTLVGH